MATAATQNDATETIIRRSRIRVHGTVQGVGFRPFVYRLAHSLNLAGWVLNGPDGVVIEVEGAAAAVAAFAPRLQAELPPLAQITSLAETPTEPKGDQGFVILDSEEGEQPTALIPADVATCPRCAAEVDDPADRRYHYPFTNCTDCGPRFTIVETVPYDRARTTMRRFPMCPACGAEYETPTSRRFHAEPNACPACGPHLWLAETAAAASAATTEPRDPEALEKAAARLRAGEILAIKGLGGFHLACDARNSEAVRRLRAVKRRQAKPFALMVRDLAEAERHCMVSAAERAALESPEHPILLLAVREESAIAPEVAPGQRTLGIMLPYTPLHRLLLEIGPAALVMTSGNLSEEPIAHDNADAAARLGGMADAFLFHNRPIQTACDDSVARVVEDRLLLIRRARGFVPRAIALPQAQEPVLACGGQQKNTFCLARGTGAVLSQHIGDLDNVETLEYYGRAVEHFRSLFRAVPQVVAHDLHPEYLSTRYALEAARSGGQAIAVQHHHAHIASCMADNGLNGSVIGVAFDGTGYGTDGSLWGGEFLIADYREFRRAAHLRPIRLPGGEAAIRRPARTAYAYLLDAFPEGEAEQFAQLFLPALSEAERAAIRWQTRSGAQSPWSSGAGRLFDAVSALLGICAATEYEGQAAIELELAAGDGAAEPLPFEIAAEADCRSIDLRPTVHELLQAREQNVPTPLLAARFHATLAAAIATVCRLLAAETGLRRVCLSGGTFQNVRLLHDVITRLRQAELAVYWHRQAPPNDGGLSLGQAVIAGAIIG